MNELQLFRVLFDTYFERVYRSTCLIIQDESIARDAAQEAFIVAYEQLDSLKDLDKLYTWLTSVAANRAKDMIKKHHSCMPAANIDDVLAEPAYSTVNIEHKDMELDIMQALHMVDIKYREVAVYKYYLGFTDKEMGKILALPSGTVKSRLSRARMMLKDILEPDTESGAVL